VGPRASLDDVVKREFLTLPGLELRPLGRPARSQSLYRLGYPGSVADNSTYCRDMGTVRRVCRLWGSAAAIGIGVPEDERFA
jgi:hypothetical protein